MRPCRISTIQPSSVKTSGSLRSSKNDIATLTCSIAWKMLGLLKSGVCSNLGEAARTLGYSRRQCQRWFITYRQEGLEELLVSRVGERGRRELVTEEAWAELEEAMKQEIGRASCRERV